MRRFHQLAACAAALFLGACATSFVGNADFPGGAKACSHRCEIIQMDMAAYVYVGEYSTACVCQVRRQGAPIGAETAAVAAAAAGVADQAQRQQAMMASQPPPMAPVIMPPPH